MEKRNLGKKKFRAILEKNLRKSTKSMKIYEIYEILTDDEKKRKEKKRRKKNKKTYIIEDCKLGNDNN